MRGPTMEGSSRDKDRPSYLIKQELNSQIAVLENEISSVDAEIAQLRQLRESLTSEKNGLLKNLDAVSSDNRKPNASNAKGKQKATPGIDYTETFEWSDALKARMKAVFGIESFRLCQEAVCNANMDNRDIVCVMPTGGGKSLTYQLPALLVPGCTLVISPLISLITDQIIHLREAGVEAVMLTGSTSKEQSREITSRLTQSHGMHREIKLCYVTPEKIAKSKMFTSVLERMASSNRLARIVIDEAHCVSQLGHDFRPDYKKLAILRQLFPRVPILALSATCPPAVLKDLLMVLKLKPVEDGSAASMTGTVYFSAPLYRKNLHYNVLPKPSSATAVLQTMTDYILNNHKRDSGIVYCLSKKDAETVAAGIAENSDGKIKTGIYHADVGDKEKETLHKRWRKGEIQVVCATIAFGLGIDMATVRFVLHHSMSKSLDGFYQESGRAGRDGKDADCVLYYRGQDATRLSSLTCGEINGQEKLYDMLRFAQNVTDCRKVLFANYFSASSSLSLASWTSSTAGALTPCGHCDNCTRPVEDIDHRDTTLEAWQTLKVLREVERQGGRVTLGMLADLIRGAGGGSFAVGGGGRKGKAKEKVGLDMDEIAGGKVLLSKDDAETLLIQMMLSHYLKEDFHPTAYSINVYVLSGPQAMRLTRLSREAVEGGAGQRIQSAFLKKQGRKGSTKTRRKDSTTAKPPANGKQTKLDSTPTKRKSKKRKRSTVSNDGDLEIDEIEDSGEFNDFIVEDDDDVGYVPSSDGDIRRISPAIFKSPDHSDDDLWTFTMNDDDPPVRKRHRTKAPVRGPTSDDEVVVLSD